MAKDRTEEFKMISLRVLADKSGVGYSKIYHNLKGTYASLTDQEKTMIFNSMYQEFEKASAILGFTADGRRIKPKG
jgi:predicted DNA-binding protein YlxM (UPF0122 family)